MIIEFQITRTRFEELLHQRLIAARPCIVDAITWGNETYYVASIVIGKTKLEHAVGEEEFALNVLLASGDIGPPLFGPVVINLKRLQVVQEVTVRIAGLHAMKEANDQQAAAVFVPVTLRFSLAVGTTEDGRPRFCARVSSPDDIDIDLPDLGGGDGGNSSRNRCCPRSTTAPLSTSVRSPR